VTGSAFVRSFGSKDRKTVAQRYAAIHTEAEAHFFALISGRAMTDQDLFGMAMTEENLTPLFRLYSGKLNAPADWQRFIAQHGTDQMKALTAPDRDRLIIMLNALYAGTETVHLEIAHARYEEKREYIGGKFGQPAAPQGAFTLEDAYQQAWIPAKKRPNNTITETSRYVAEFVALNGTLDLRNYTRDHWAKWRADCLEKHGPGWTAFKRFTMMKTICAEAIRAGLFERKNFAGQDVTMRKPPRSQIRNEGWQVDELSLWFSAPLFNGVKEGTHPDANYWAAVITAYTGATMMELSHIDTADVAQRHGFWTVRLWRDKSANSFRVIPIPKQVLDLGFLAYLKTRPKGGALFVRTSGERVTNKDLSSDLSEMRSELGITRKGATPHTYRHHIKTVLADLGCPERVSDYITGHAPPNVGRTYGKVEFSTALQYLDKVDLGVKIPKWKP
jgi:integrase